MRKILKNKKKKGFTLIEMVAVVAIIGILAAILVPKVTGYMKEAKKTGVIDQARKVTQAYETAEMKDKLTDGEGVKQNTTTALAINNIKNKTILSLLDVKESAGATGLQTTLDKLYGGKESSASEAKIATIAECFDIVAGGEFNVDKDGKLIGTPEDVASK